MFNPRTIDRSAFGRCVQFSITSSHDSKKERLKLEAFVYVCQRSGKDVGRRSPNVAVGCRNSRLTKGVTPLQFEVVWLHTVIELDTLKESISNYVEAMQ